MFPRSGHVGHLQGEPNSRAKIQLVLQSQANEQTTDRPFTANDIGRLGVVRAVLIDPGAEAGRGELKGHLYSCAYAATCAPARAIGFPPRHASHRK